VRAIEALVQETIRAADAEPLAVIGADGTVTRPALPRNEHLASLEQELRLALGTQVELRTSRSGRGRMIVHFKNHDEFERLHSLLCGSPARRQAG
jgi:ParB family chromosome partitioning protein